MVDLGLTSAQKVVLLDSVTLTLSGPFVQTINGTLKIKGGSVILEGAGSMTTDKSMAALVQLDSSVKISGTSSVAMVHHSVSTVIKNAAIGTAAKASGPLQLVKIGSKTSNHTVLFDTVTITKVDIPAGGLINVIGDGKAGSVDLNAVTFTDMAPSNTNSNLNILELNKVGKVILNTVKTTGCKSRLVMAVESDIELVNSVLAGHTLFLEDGGVLNLIDSYLAMNTSTISGSKGAKYGGAILVDYTSEI